MRALKPRSEPVFENFKYQSISKTEKRLVTEGGSNKRIQAVFNESFDWRSLELLCSSASSNETTNEQQNQTASNSLSKYNEIVPKLLRQSIFFWFYYCVLFVKCY